VFHSQIDELDSRISELSNSKGLVDSWRRNQLRKARSRLVGDAARLAGARTESRAVDIAGFNARTSAQRAANEVPLALLSDYTQRRGQDKTVDIARMRDTTDRYGIDTRDTTERYGIDTRSSDARRQGDLDFMPKLGQVAAGAELYRAQSRGASLDEVGDIAEAYGLRNPRTPKGPTTEKIGQGESFVVTKPDGSVEVFGPDELARRTKLPRQNKQTRDQYPE
jgi:hypothetical protein